MSAENEDEQFAMTDEEIAAADVAHTKRVKRNGAIAVLVAVIMVGLIVFGRSGGSDSGADYNARFACDHFRGMANDIKSGGSGAFEGLAKLMEIYDHGSVSSVSDIAISVQALFKAVTSGDTAAIDSSSDSFLAACVAIGH